jgi:hypothetical protein
VKCIDAVKPQHDACVEACFRAHQDRLYGYKCQDKNKAHEDALYRLEDKKLTLQRAELDLSAAYHTVASDALACAACALAPPVVDVACLAIQAPRYKASLLKLESAKIAREQAHRDWLRANDELLTALYAAYECNGTTYDRYGLPVDPVPWI